MEQKLEFGSHHAGLVTGLGLEFANYHLKNNVLLAYDRDSIYGVPMESPDYRKNKLRQMGLRVPLMLEFNTKRAVSYTHLRAHETVLDLVCRLLLEKKKKNTVYGVK